MDEIVQLVASVTQDNDEITVFKIKASNTGLLLKAVKDGRKWYKNSRTKCAGLVSVRYLACAGGYTCPNTKYLFSNNLDVLTVQTFRGMT